MCQTLLVSGNLMICPGPTTLKQFAPRPGACLPSSIVSSHPIVMPTLFWLYISFPSLDVGPTSKDGLGSYLTQCNTLLWKLQVTLELKLSDQFKITPLINTTSNSWSPLSFLTVSCTSLVFFFIYRHSPNPRTSHSKQLLRPFAKACSFYNSFFVHSVCGTHFMPTLFIVVALELLKA